ncbi:polyribonucleotide nucleotidyltransferase [Neisseria polysaccharea]|uniref:Polyribonucleotide nucleotidyltransferase n=1 Tax=Neisseria polysaccharea TaxID=489 RepID=A0ABV1JLZ6_NEIPO
MKTITEKLASQLNSREKANAAADTLTALLLLVNDGVSRKAAINAVAAITREAMDRYGETGR